MCVSASMCFCAEIHVKCSCVESVTICNVDKLRSFFKLSEIGRIIIIIISSNLEFVLKLNCLRRNEPITGQVLTMFVKSV